VIDIHTHLLPGVDDGSPTEVHSALVLARMADEGVRAVVCTPHLNASQADRAPLEEYHRLLLSLRAASPPAVTLHAGWEIMLDRFGVDLTPDALGLAGSRARLVEFPRRGLPVGAAEELLRLRACGVVPVVAHPERYHECAIETFRAWHELGAVLQCDAFALLTAGPLSSLARGMFAEGLIDIVASDNHGDRRSLSTARQWMEEIGAPDQAVLTMEENPHRLLSNQPLQPVSPFRFSVGMLDRLRSAIFGGRRSGSGGPVNPAETDD
jgi:protein-tyrosine phosphatase